MSERSPTRTGPSRRSVLRAAATATGAVGLAGCITFDPGGDGDSSDEPTSEPVETELTTPSATGTPTAFPAPPFDDDCIQFDPETVEIVEEGDRWLITSGNGSQMLLFDDFENAKTARDAIQHYGFAHHCFVGRPDAPMSYWLATPGE